MRPRPKPVLWFAAHAIALTLLIGLWPTPRAAYPALFHAHANALLAHLDAPRVRLGPPSRESGRKTDTEMTGAPRPGAEPEWRSWFSVGRIGYWPSAMLVAMLLATPLAPLRRAIAVAVGLALVDAFTLARIGVEIAYASTARLGAASESGTGRLLLQIGSESLTATIPSAAFVLVCWAVIASPWRTIDLGAARAALGMDPH
ncbi:MAG TPA: hypothetical protein VKH41_16630 [Myxococcota bacterium]|nr:hypothetical protein [Myxococcota bacterium]